MSDQFLRRASLVVATSDQALDLSELRFTFRTKQADIQTPNACWIRVFNLSDQTAQTIQKEFTRVVLQAGYENGGYGVIFDGTIKQVRRGRVSPVDKYVDILAADGDAGLNFAVMNASLAAGSTPADRVAAAARAMEAHGVTVGYTPDLSGPALPRGKVLYGMARDELRLQSATLGMTYSVQNGKLVMVPLNGFVPGESVVLTSETGMIGMPEQMDDGIRVRCLLNPQLAIGCKVKIDNASIQRAQMNPSIQGELQFEMTNSQARVTDDGVYRIFVIEHSGDTRGNDWISNIICLSVDDTTSMGLASRGQG